MGGKKTTQQKMYFGFLFFSEDSLNTNIMPQAFIIRFKRCSSVLCVFTQKGVFDLNFNFLFDLNILL